MSLSTLVHVQAAAHMLSNILLPRPVHVWMQLHAASQLPDTRNKNKNAILDII